MSERPRRSSSGKKSYKEPKESDIYLKADEDEEAEEEEAEEVNDDEPERKKRKGELDVKTYRSRMIRQGKELCKDPPTLPPLTVVVLSERVGEMTRRKDGTLISTTHPDFRPNLTPAEVLQRGSFGGTYFRAITSAVTGESYGDEVWREFPSEWFAGLNMKTQVTSQKYRQDINRYGVKCGTSLDAWESSGWISPIDPYGWFHWYCRYYLGRRSSDDERQIQRWLAGEGPKGRWRSQLANKIIRANTHVDDPRISPVIRQTCQHWAYVITAADLEAHRKRTSALSTSVPTTIKKKPGASSAAVASTIKKKK